MINSSSSFSTHHHTCEGTFRQWIHDSELVLTRNACRLRAVNQCDAHPDPSGTVRSPSAPNPTPRAPHQPPTVPLRNRIPQHKVLLRTQSNAHAHRRSRTTPIETQTFGSPTRSRVRRLRRNSAASCPCDLRKSQGREAAELVGAFRDTRWCVVRRVPDILLLGLC